MAFSDLNFTKIPQNHLSQTIGLSRIILIIGLVFLHYGNFPNSAVSPFQGLDLASHSFITWLNSAVLFFFYSVVPLLSIISGWLFFSFSYDQAKEALKQRIIKRFFSLYIPLIIWNIFALSIFYVAIYRNTPDAPFMGGISEPRVAFSEAGLWDFINGITGIINGVPTAFQFWFVHDLYMAVLISPIFLLALRYMPYVGAIVLAGIWLYGYNMLIFSRPDVAFFFYLGGLLRYNKMPLTISAKITYASLAFYVMLVCLRALSPLIVGQVADPFWLEVATRLMRIIGVLACWGVLYRAAQSRLGQKLSKYGALAFFLHSAHWPLLPIVKMYLWQIIPGESGFWMVVHWWGSVCITITICLSSGLLLAHFIPRFFALMNGGRLYRAATT